MPGLNLMQAQTAFAMRKDGNADFAKIGKTIGVSRGVVRYHFQKNGDPLDQSIVCTAPEQDQEVIAMRKKEQEAIAMQKKGATTAEIAAATGLTERQVQYHTVEKPREKAARARPVHYVRHEPSPEQWADLERRQTARNMAPLSVILCGDPVIPRHESNKDAKPRRATSDPFFAWNVSRKRRLVPPLERKRSWQQLPETN